METPEIIHRILGDAFLVQVERYIDEPQIRISIQPVSDSERIQLELFASRQCTADAALELSRSLHLCAVMVGYLAAGGTIECWSDDRVREISR